MTGPFREYGKSEVVMQSTMAEVMEAGLQRFVRLQLLDIMVRRNADGELLVDALWDNVWGKDEFVKGLTPLNPLKLHHPAVTAVPYRPQLIPYYNARYREWAEALSDS